MGAFAVALAIVFGTRQKLDKSQVEGPADRVVVEKGQHTLSLLRGGKVLKVYRVALGRGGAGPKLKAGDNKVPEGTYRIVGRNSHSAFHRALRVGYPTPEEVAQARSRAIDPGGDIMVHGIRNLFGWGGWDRFRAGLIGPKGVLR